ncbi:MAG: cyclic nucleotide-binding domain-containing protein [Undibacterium sp.]|nr:cyclic nucleotide-binding domain-containing protein [Opitutaceae bacterium]
MPSTPAPHPSGALATELATLAASGQTRRYLAGEVIFLAGAPGDGFHVVQSGRVHLTAVVGDAAPRVLAAFGAGDFFGEMAVLDDAPRSATAVAEHDTVTLFLGRDALLQLLDARPRLALDLIREFSRRMRALNQKYVDEILQAERLAVVGRFAGTIVHDFKNPLAVIGLAAEVACGESTAPAMRAKAESTIARQVERITAMLQELIDFTRPSGQKVVQRPVNFADFMAPLAEEIGHEVAGRNVRLVLPAPPPALTVRIDAQRLSRVFYNLVNNAVDAMRDGGGTVTLRFVADGGALRIEVEDNGKGIAPEIAQKLFEPFATHGKTHGTGLGLSICRKIVEDHGGRIWAHSEPGRGALFCFTLPLHA